MKNKKRRSFQLSEKQLGYAMVIPSLVLVMVVVLWPVAQSFYNSLFDYRLNDPLVPSSCLVQRLIWNDTWIINFT